MFKYSGHSKGFGPRTARGLKEKDESNKSQIRGPGFSFLVLVI